MASTYSPDSPDTPRSPSSPADTRRDRGDEGLRALVVTLLASVVAVLHSTGAAVTRLWAATAVAVRRGSPAVEQAGKRASSALADARGRTVPAVVSAAGRTQPLLRRIGAGSLTVCNHVGAAAISATVAVLLAVRSGLRAVGGATLVGIGAVEHGLMRALAAVGARTLDFIDRTDAQISMRLGDVGRTTTAARRGRIAMAPAVVEDPAEVALPAAAWEPEPEPPLLARAVAGAGGVVFSLMATALVLVLAGAVVLGPVTQNAGSSVDVALTLPDDAALAALEERSLIYAADGSVLSVLDREVDRDIVELDTIPQHVIDAVVTAEDRKFWDHPGYDIEGIGRALVANVEAGTIEQGGSTITQQLAKSQVGTERSLDRKFSELLYAVALEERFTKEQLIEQYLNQVYFGANSYGIAAAAEEFFHKSYRDLTPDEAALLAGGIRSPNSTNPRVNPEVAERRRNLILADMVALGYLPRADLRDLQDRPLGVLPPPEKQNRIPHVVDSVVREFLVGAEFAAFGATAEQREDALYRGGLRIHTSVVPAMQTVATEVIEQFYPPDISGPTAAIAAVEPATGRILAADGGLSYSDEQYDLATQGRRQPGSAFKPFVYATALQMGFPQTLSLEGASPTYFEGICGWAREDPPGCDTGGKQTGVRNYGGASYGRMDMRRALINSVNTATAQLILAAGPENVAETARKMGVNMDAALRRSDTGESPVNAAIALGGLENGTTPLEMASSYGTFANGGVHVPAHFIDRIEDGDGREVYRSAHAPSRVFDPAVNAAMVDIMQGVVSGGTGTRAQLAGWSAAGKTGTTQRNADAWFVGYVPVLSTAVWVGHPEGQIPMRGATGGQRAAPVWQAFMSRVLQGIEPVSFPQVDFSSGRIVEGDPVPIPDVRRLSDTDAMRALTQLRLIPDVSQVPSAAARGTVVWQSPQPGGTAQPGDTITLGVSSGDADSQRSGGRSSRSDSRDDDD